MINSPTLDREEVGRQLADLRRAKGLTIRQLADIAGINKATVVNLEAGKFDPRLSTLNDYLRPLGGRVAIEIEGA